ncbi:hypothetical protein BpHYR1_016078 [Brachionus plicatilis]|uniref:Uncharacterized protein n=1 Tax=Brachionus plicatilis TaxID=10195 RepID=A0A3M7SLW5_BRAPC|nr:hypothetical protein BpHYR1_016078 [Brachionus plicatilis]
MSKPHLSFLGSHSISYIPELSTIQVLVLGSKIVPSPHHMGQITIPVESLHPMRKTRTFYDFIFKVSFLFNDGLKIRFSDLNPCQKDHYYNTDHMACVYDPLYAHQNCDTLEDKCPSDQFCSPNFFKCIPSLAEKSQCAEYFPIRQVILCNKIDNLYCFNNRCQRALSNSNCSRINCSWNEVCNPLRGACERLVSIFHCDPSKDLCYLNSDSFCHPRMKICVNYLAEGDFCDHTHDFCNKRKGLACSKKNFCEKID